ncbi:uncharacterized protein LOC101852742 [Aplysia californica]|uniref:Uncharacterized protein LOC101852742 n=1 Tax=Aplysia californica TaxID=6500 RepID=A0ABM0JBY0_APLCA|nr:uncharacterized protein LOC101852742 [Aplysia californica]
MDIKQKLANDKFSRLSTFPCTFNLDPREVTLKRMNILKRKLPKELEDDNLNEERVQILNLISWIEYRLNDAYYALEWNKKALDSFEKEMENVSTIANQGYLLLLSGDEIAALKVIERLEKLKSQNSYQILKRRALADQGFALFRLGYVSNLSRSIKLYEEAIKSHLASPEIHLWKYQLGAVKRRASSGDIFSELPGDCSPLDYLEGAKKLLLDVAESCSDCTLKGRAFAELVSMNPTDTVSWKMAIECNKKRRDVFLLTTLGKATSSTDPDRAIYVLEESLKIRKTSTAYHHLAICYEKKAKDKLLETYGQCNEQFRKSPKVEQNKRIGLFGAQLLSEQEIYLDKDGEMVAKALKCYEKALKLVDWENVPAKHGYGLLLKACGATDEALKQFNQITISHVHSGYQGTAILAYEQAAKCLLILSEKEESSESRSKYKEEAKKKLLQAVSISADIAKGIPDMKSVSEDIWAFFRQMHDSDKVGSSDEAISLETDRKLLGFMRLVKRYGEEMLDVVKKLLEYSEEELDDENVIVAGLESYLKIKSFDEAMVFLRLCQTRRSALENNLWSKDPLKKLSIRVLLLVAQDKLLGRFGEAIAIFKSLFTSVYGNRSHPDVLIVYDESHDGKKGMSYASQAARELQTVMCDLFDLEVSTNLQSCGEYGKTVLELMIQEMKKSRVVVLLLGQEPMDSVFEYLLKMVPQINIECTKEGQIPPHVFVATTEKEVKVPLLLEHHRQLCICDILILSKDVDAGVQLGQGCGYSPELTNELMTLFCFLTGNTWPLPPEADKPAQELSALVTFNERLDPTRTTSQSRQSR